MSTQVKNQLLPLDIDVRDGTYRHQMLILILIQNCFLMKRWLKHLIIVEILIKVPIPDRGVTLLMKQYNGSLVGLFIVQVPDFLCFTYGIVYFVALD